MRTIYLRNYVLPNKSSVYTAQRKYYVLLGNEARRYFSSEKEVKFFLAETNRFLNARLHELNFFIGLVYADYRKAWFYLDNYKSEEKQIKNCFEHAENAFFRAGTKSGTINANVFIFNYINDIVQALDNITNLLATVFEEKSFYSDLYRVKGISRQVLIIKSEIDCWGKIELTVRTGT